MISSAAFIENGPEAEARRLPSDKDMRVISTEEARRIFGTEAERLDGVSVSTFPLTCSSADSLNFARSGSRTTRSNCMFAPSYEVTIC